ncbi:MAG TPA: glucose-6-phosphate dehydrogenase assembly protein OpcA [Polyangiaceae bacterium]
MSDSPAQVLARVDREVRAFWSVPPPPGETPTARACTTNLVVVTATPELATRWIATVDEVLKSVSARALVVGLDPDGDDSLEAQTTQVCVPASGGGAAVCSERVTLQARGAVCARVSSIIDSLCVNDVPRTLVWLGRVHADDLVFGPLAASVDRIVLDTSQTSTHGTLSDLAHAVRWAKKLDASARPGIADLAWTRLAPWQEMCARMFDEPRLRALAGKVSRLGMVQSSPQGAALASEGGLILGWLATQLGWKAVSLAGKLRLLRADDGSVRALLRAEVNPAAPGSLLAIEIEATDGPLSIQGSIRRDPNEADAALWRLDVKGPGGDTQRLEQRVRLRAAEPARLLERTLHRPPHDGALTESVEWAEGLHGEELVCG